MIKGLRAGSVFDGTGRPEEADRILLYEEGRIVDLLPGNQEEMLRGRGVTVEDFTDCFLMPGMIDAHVHLMLPGDGTPAEDFLAAHSPEEVLLTAAKNAGTALRSGVTVLRDCGGLPEVVFPLREAVRKGITPGPELILCGSSLTTTGGHTHFFGGETDTPEETVQRIRELHKEGADFVKLIATGGGTKGVIQYAQMLSDAQLSAACEEAHRLGKTATAHACTTATAAAAVHAGVDMLEHLIWADERNLLCMDEALREELAEKDIPVCITMSVLGQSIRAYEERETPLDAAERANYEMLCRFRDTIEEGYARTAGDLRYIPGTDAGWRGAGFDTLHLCMENMARLGAGNRGALRAATGLAAEVLGIADRVGTLAPGKQADFVLLSASPVEKIANLRQVKAVFQRGNRV